MKPWARQHPLGSQALVFGLVFPLLTWIFSGLTGLSGFPRPVRPLDFMTYWVVLGGLSGCVYYVVERLIVKLANVAMRRPDSKEPNS